MRQNQTSLGGREADVKGLVGKGWLRTQRGQRTADASTGWLFQLDGRFVYFAARSACVRACTSWSV